MTHVETHAHHHLISRRALLAGGAVATAGMTLAPAAPASAGRVGTSTFPRKATPQPITQVIPTAEPGFDPPPPFDLIHWLLPGPTDASTPHLGLPGFGLDVDPSTIGDFRGDIAYAVVDGTATDQDGGSYDVEFDVRVMDGRYRDGDGNVHRGTFGFF